LNHSLERLMDLGGLSGKITGNMIRTGNDVLGETSLGDFVRMQDIIRGDFGRTISKVEDAILNIPIEFSGESEGVWAGETERDWTEDARLEAGKSSTAAAIETVKTVPMSVPAVSSQAASQIVSESPSAVARKQNVIATASGAKLQLMEQYAGYIARYDGKESPHKKRVEKIIEETQSVVESSKQYAHTVGKMEAQQAIARVGADQIALLALQNVLLANINDTLADEIVLLSKIGLAGTEEYSENIRNILERHIEIYSGIRGE